MYKKFSDFIFNISNKSAIKSIRRGLILVMPMVIIGAFIAAFLNLPINAYQNFMVSLFGNDWKQLPMDIYYGTTSIMTVVACVTISYEYSNNEKLVKTREINPIYVVITTVSVLFMFVIKSLDMQIAIKDLGAVGLFRALIFSIAVPFVFFKVYKIYVKTRKKKNFDYNGSPIVQAAFYITIPILITLFLFATIKMVLDLSGFGSWFSDKFTQIYLQLILNPSLISYLLIVLITQVLWFFGVHGGNLFLDALKAANLEGLIGSGAAHIISKEVLDSYIFIGGAGATLGLLIALLIFGENNGTKKLGKSAIIPGILNINEPIIYGLPILFNPYYLLPFIFSPIILTFTTSLFIKIGFIPGAAVAETSWTTPLFLSGYIASGKISGIIVQAVNLSISFLCYAPFVIMQKRSLQKHHLKEFENLVKELQYINMVQQNEVISLNNERGALARHLASELELGLLDKKEMLYLVYQPKMDNENKVIGCEALLRCKHPVLGVISPMTVVSICDEAGLTNELGRWVFRKAIEDQKDFMEHKEFESLVTSINLNPNHLRGDDQLVTFMTTELEQNHVPAELIQVELTENSVVVGSENNRGKLKQLSQLGIKIAIDDFGMGHSSLNYIQKFFVGVVKLDMCLITGIDSNNGNKEIVKSIIGLCKELGVFVIAEGVENKEEFEVLRNLGCPGYQGYYFSEPLEKDDYIKFSLEHTLK